MTGRTIPLLPALLTFIAICILCALGAWQIQRLEWKTNLLTHLDAEYARAAAKTNLKPADLRGDFLFKRGQVHGTYAFNEEILIGPRMYEDAMGFHVITPLRLRDGSYLLVDRGWVPQNWTDASKRPDAANVTGLLRRPDAANSFTPVNHPDKNQWYNINPDEIAAAKHLDKISPYVLYAEGAARAGVYPIPQGAKPQLPNNHFFYAIFWFSMAGALLIIFILRFKKPNAA